MNVQIFLIIALLLMTHASGAVHAQQQQTSATWSASIVPGDVLMLHIWREDEMSINQTVPAHGVINFQRLGPIDVRGMTTDSLRQRLVREYSRYLTEPESRIQVEVHRKVRVTGAVRNPNIYTLHPTMTVADALASAGGATPEGRGDRVELRRDGDIIELLLLSDGAQLADSPIRSGDQLHVPERTFASRNFNVLVTAVTSVLAVAIALLAR